METLKSHRELPILIAKYRDSYLPSFSASERHSRQQLGTRALRKRRRHSVNATARLQSGHGHVSQSEVIIHPIHVLRGLAMRETRKRKRARPRSLIVIDWATQRVEIDSRWSALESWLQCDLDVCSIMGKGELIDYQHTPKLSVCFLWIKVKLAILDLVWLLPVWVLFLRAGACAKLVNRS